MKKKVVALVLLLLLSVSAPAWGGIFDLLQKKDKPSGPVPTTVEVPAEAPPAVPEGTVEGGGEAVEEDAADKESYGEDLDVDDTYVEDDIYAEDGIYGADQDEEPEIGLEDILYGVSTDEALLRLARIYAGKEEFEKAARAYQRLIEDFPGSKFKYDAFYELGFLRYRKGRLREARLLLQYVVSSWRVDYVLKNSARALLDDVESIYSRGKYRPKVVSIGVLLPLKRGYKRFGEAALRGILLAVDVFSGKGLPVEIYVRDTGADPESVRAAIDELVVDKRVRGIVGPLLSSVAREAVVSAQARRVPMITLSQKAGITEVGDFVFRSSLMPSVQASMVARYAYNNLGKRSFAILHPRNNYGATLARFFAAEVESLGGTVVSTASYKPGVRDFGTQLVEIFEIEETERKEGRRTIKEYTQALQVDALYIPEYYQTVSLIVPYLEYYNIEEVQLLGSNGWNTTKLIELNGKNVEDAVFADGFFAGSSRPDTVEFVDRFRKAYGRVPGVLEAQAYDGASALLAALAENDFKWMDWRAVKDGVRGTTDLRGSSGSFSFDENGEAVKRLFLLKVDGRRIVEIEGGTQVEVEGDTQAEPSGEL